MSKARGLADLGNAFDDGALSNRNLIINGAMQVAQRGTSFSAIGSATYTLDRWRGQSRASSVINVTKVDNVNVDGRIMSVLQHQVTTPATDGLTLQNHFVEDGSITLLGQTVTVSCWARVTVGAATVEQQFEVDGGIYTFTSGVTTLTTSFQRIAFTTTLSGYTTSISNKHLRYQLYIRGASAHTVQITGVQLEVGDTATPFEHRSYGDELARCQRYYERVETSHRNSGSGYFTNFGNGAWVGPSFKFKVTKRATPTTVTDLGTLSWRRANFRNAAATTIGTGATSVSATTTDSTTVQISESGPSSGNTALVFANAGYTIEADAEL